MSLRRLIPAIPLLLVACGAGAQQASISSGSTSAATVNPYVQKRSQAYTSFDNPYAPGGIYDPYRQQRPGGPDAATHKKLPMNTVKASGLGGISASSRSCGNGLNGGSGFGASTSSSALSRSTGRGAAGSRSSLGGTPRLGSAGSGCNGAGLAGINRSSMGNGASEIDLGQTGAKQHH